MRMEIARHRQRMSLGVLIVLLLVPWMTRGAEPVRQGNFMESFDGEQPQVSKRSPRINYEISLGQGRYFVHVPASYTGKEPFGLIVFIHAGDRMEQLPPGWGPVLSQRKLLFLAPQNSGNNQDSSRRRGLAVLGALKMMERYKIDPQRVYASGFSGGARIAGMVAFFQPEVFRGTIQNCGADFCGPVPQVNAKPIPGRDNGPYGVFEATADEIGRAKRGVRFVFITGTKDFRHGNILDIYHGGYAKAGFQAKLLDVPGMEHDVCTAAVLTTALGFLESQDTSESPATGEKETGSAGSISITPVAKTSRPAWVTQEPAQWPQILLSHEARLKPNLTFGGASGFLMKLPNGAVVAATAKHIVGEQISLDQLNDSIVSWAMYPRGMPQKKVSLRKHAMKADTPVSLDCLVMAVNPMQTWPVEVLTARRTPAGAGETVFLVAVPYDEKKPQNVYKGVVRRPMEGRCFAYTFDTTVDSRGFSGAPVIDVDGNVVGIHLGKYSYESGPDRVLGRAIDIGAAVEAADAPGPISETAPMTRPEEGTKVQSERGGGDAAAKASSALEMAKNYLALKKYDLARPKLQAIADTYPDTPAAKEAKALLKEIEGK
ncbi:MAG: trypsin-like peptidase domain-containing protein [Bacillota bacterium]